MATTAEGQAKLDKMLAAGMGRQQALGMLIAAQKKANAQTEQAPAETESVSVEAEPVLTEAELTPAETGNVAVDQANVLSSILNSPLYTESIKGAYLTQYLPGLTQANYEINKARAQEVQNSFLRQQAQAQAIREVAGSYAARGMRTPKMVTEGFAPIQQSTEMQRSAAEQAINDLVANKEVLYGAGTTDQESFIKNPTLFGSVGAGARREALSGLQQLPEFYGLTQVAGASTSPFGTRTNTMSAGEERMLDAIGSGRYVGSDVWVPRYDGTWGPQYSPDYFAPKISATQAKIDAANKYIASQQAKGNATTVAGAQKKLATYENALQKYQTGLEKVRGY